MNVVIAAAGTAGHVYPALAVAEELVGRGLDRSQIVFFGGDRIERQAVPSAGFPFVEFRLAKLRRSVSLSNLAIPAVVSGGARRMRSELERRGAGGECFGSDVGTREASRRTGQVVIVNFESRPDSKGPPI